MGGSGKKKKEADKKAVVKRKDGGGDGKRDPGKFPHKGGGRDGPTAGDSPPTHSNAKRSRNKSKEGKFISTFKKVEQPHTSGDTSSSHTRVTRSQTVNESTTGSPVKGDQTTKSTSHTTATVAEDTEMRDVDPASLNTMERALDDLFGPSSSDTSLKQPTSTGTDKVVPGVWTEKQLLQPSGQPLDESGLRQFTESTESVTSGSQPQNVGENNSNLDRSIVTPPHESDVDEGELELEARSEASVTPSLSDGEIADEGDEVEVVEVVISPKRSTGKKPAHTTSGRQPARKAGDQPHSSYGGGDKRAPAPQRNKGGPGQQSCRQLATHEAIGPIPRMSHKLAKEKFDLNNFVIDTHMHVMEYTGRYFKNAKSYRQWSRSFKEVGLPFALGVEILHDPALWSVSDANRVNGPISYVRQGYSQIIPAGKYPICTVACHPKFSDPKSDQEFYGAERIKAELSRVIRESYSDFNGMEIIAIGEFGLQFGVAKEEKNKVFPRQVSDAQKKLFMAHADVAKDTGLPIVLHIRGRDFGMQQELERLAIQYLQEGGLSNQHVVIRHSYAGGAVVAQEWVDAYPKTYFSYGPVSRSWKQAAAGMDTFDPGLIRTLVETDCPLQERDEPENARLPPNSQLRVPSHPDTTLTMLRHLCAAREAFTLEETAKRVAAATMTAFDLNEARVLAALMCPVEPEADTIAQTDHEVAFPGHHTRFSNKSGQQNPQTQSTQPARSRADRAPKLKASLVKAAIAGAARGNAGTRPSADAQSDVGEDFGDGPSQNQAAATTSKRKRSKSRGCKGAAAAAPAADEDESEFPFVVKALPARPTKLEQDELIPLSVCLKELSIDVSDKTATGLELFKECRRIHKGECTAQKVGGQVRTLNPDKISQIKSQKVRDLAERVARKDIPSIFHSIIIHYLKHIPDDRGAAKYRAMITLLDKDVDDLMDELEFILGDLIQNDIYVPHKIADQHIYQGVHSWTYCCRYPYNCAQHRKTVGPINYEQGPRRELSAFGDDLLNFILFHIPDGIDHNRMHRQGDRQLLIRERVVFIGDSVAASLASRVCTSISLYVEVYTIKELAKFLNAAYFGYDVRQVIIAVGRHDLSRFTFNGNLSLHTFYVEHVLTTLARNFPHVRFTFVLPPYTHTQRAQWEQHVLETSVDSAEVLTGVIREQRCIQAFPRLYRSLYYRSSNEFDENQDWMDQDGNLRWGGLVNIVRHLQTTLKVEVFELGTKVEGSPLVPRYWKVQDFTRGPPTAQQNAPYGKGCLQYLSEEELPATRFDMRPPVDSDSQRSESRTEETSYTSQQLSDRPSASHGQHSGRSPQGQRSQLSYPRPTTPQGERTSEQTTSSGTQYHMPEYQLASDTTAPAANPPVSQGQPPQMQRASTTAAQATTYIPSPLQVYGTGASYAQQPYYPSPLHRQPGVSQGQPQQQAPQPMLQTTQASYAPPPPAHIPPPPSQIPLPPAGFGTLFQPGSQVAFGQSMTAPQTSSGNAGQPWAPQAHTVGPYGGGAGYLSFQADQSQFPQIPAPQFQQYGVSNIPMPSAQPQFQSQTPGSDGYHSMPTTAPPSVSQTPASQQHQPQPPSSSAAPVSGPTVTLTPELFEALVRAGLLPPQRQ